MKNGSEGRDVIGDSRKRYRARGQRKENTDRTEKKNTELGQKLIICPTGDVVNYSYYFNGYRDNLISNHNMTFSKNCILPLICLII